MGGFRAACGSACAAWRGFRCDQRTCALAAGGAHTRLHTSSAAAPFTPLPPLPGHDPRDSSSAAEPVPDFAAGLSAQLPDKPLAGKRVGVIAQTMGAGVAPGVAAAVQGAVKHLEALGAGVEEVRGRGARGKPMHVGLGGT